MKITVKVDKGTLGPLKERILDDLVDTIFSRSQENLIRPVPASKYGPQADSNRFDTGHLAGSGNVMRQPGKRTIIYSAPYAIEVEFGVLPFEKQVSYHALVKWAQRRVGLNEKDAKRMAHFTKLKIWTDGIAPYPFLREAIDYSMAHLRAGRIIKGGAKRR